MSHRSEVAARVVPSCVARSLPGCLVVAHALPAGRVSAHRVDRPVVATMITGRCETLVGGRRFESRTDHVWCEPAGEVRVNRVTAPRAHMLSILPDEDDASGLFAAVRPALAHPVQRADVDVAIVARRAWAEFADGDSVAPLALLGHVLVVVSAFARQDRRRHHASRPHWLPRVCDYLRAHYREPFSLADVASVAAVDPAHLCRVFRAHMGTTVAEHVRRLRVAWAAGRIAEGETPLTEIALGAGFADQSHLTKVFRRHLGLTPAAYRARLSLTHDQYADDPSPVGAG